MPLRVQMDLVATSADRLFQEWHFELGISECLPNNWKDLKEDVIKFCCGLNIDTQKFKDERGSSFISRLNDWGKLNEHSEKDIVAYLRTYKCPRKLNLLFMISNSNLVEILDRVKNWEIRIQKNEINIKGKTGSKERIIGTKKWPVKAGVK